jgi:CMP-N,N'-diacetyllegionaminic acid synthase
MIESTERKESSMSDITALIMVRSGSVRCKNKNIREFADTNLLENKIKTLKEVEGIHEIVVNSDCQNMLGIAIESGCRTVLRDKAYATSETTPSELYKHVAKTIETDYVLSASVCYPMMSTETYQRLVNLHSENEGTSESVVACHTINHHLWINTPYGYEPLNYEPGNQPNSQELPEVVSICWGGIITPKKTMLQGDLIGRKPMFVDIPCHEAMDIDTELDFKISEVVYKGLQ